MSLPARQVRSRTARKAHLRVVPPPPKRRGRKRGFAAFVVVVAFLAAGSVFGLAAMNALLAQGSFRMQELSQQMEGLERQYGELRLSVADLSSAERIASEAKRLGLVLPGGEVEVVYVHGHEAGPPSRVGP